jgi:DNA-binding MltR family transcriptional regulator
MRIEPEIKELGRFLKEFNRESDRGAALIAASLLDQRLKEILESYFIQHRDINTLFSQPNAPLSTLSAKASMAYALGLIQKNEFEEITLIRKIRNEFGHKWKDVDFKNDRVVTYCNKLPWLGPSGRERKATARSRFNFAVAILLADLIWRSRLVKKKRYAHRIWPNKLRAT